MIKLLGVAIIVGLFAGSQQQETQQQEVEPVPNQQCEDTSNVRCFTDWFDRDTPCGSGDRETLDELRLENPGKICLNPTYIQVETISGLTPEETGDVIDACDTTKGFLCLNSDQPKDKECNNYRVRFVCHSPFCNGVCWTKWLNRDRPSKTGDWENLSGLRRKYPGEICKTPLYIEAVTRYTNIPATQTGNVFYLYSPTDGFVCINRYQETIQCLDYKVRFGCECKGGR